MVQIPEYTRRENAQPMQRGGMNISLPGAITQPTGGFGAAGQKALKLSSELADVFVQMKERRDDGIVSAFMNQYDKDSTQKLIELKERYRGQDAKRVMSEFQKWRDGYISQHSSYDPDSAKEGVIYLEDAAQNRIAKQKLDAYNVRDINSISSYIAEEEETFRVNNINTTVENNAMRIMSEDILPNAQISKDIIRSNITDLYRGQSKEFIKGKVDKVLSASIRSNILRNAQSDPMGSIARYNDKTFTKEFLEEDKIATRDEVLKSFKNYAAQVLAEDAAYKKESGFALNSVLSNEFFDGLSVDILKREIMDDAGKRMKDIEQTKHENSINLQNKMVSKLFDSNGKFNPDLLSTETSMNISATEGGVKTLNAINQVRVNTQNDQYNIDNGLERQPLTDDDLNRYSSVLNRLNSGYYSTIGDMFDDINMLPSDAQNELVGTFVANLQYNEAVEKLKSNGIDIERDIKTSYTELFGLKPDEGDSSFRVFRNEVIGQVENMQLTGQKLDQRSIKNAAMAARAKIDDGTSDRSVVSKLVIDLKKEQVSNYQSPKYTGRVQDYSDLSKWAENLSDKAGLDDVFDKASMKRFNDLIINGDVDSAVLMLQYYRKNAASYEQKKAAERKERLNRKPKISFAESVFNSLAYQVSGGDINAMYYTR